MTKRGKKGLALGLSLVLVLAAFMAGCSKEDGGSTATGGADSAGQIQQDGQGGETTGQDGEGSGDAQNQCCDETGSGGAEGQGSESGGQGSESGGQTGDDVLTGSYDGQGLTCSQFGRYTGAFVEDGSDEPVENVAVMLVTNTTERFLDFALLTFTVAGQEAQFQLTGLPAGASAWVLEKNRLTIEAGAEFVRGETTASFRQGAALLSGLATTLGDGSLTAENQTDTLMPEVYVYYKRLHTDGNFLGGITYRVSPGDLAAGAKAEVTAGHSQKENCQVVKTTCNENAQSE